MTEREIPAEGEPSAEQREREKQSFLLLVLTVIAVAVCLYVAREVCLPIVLAILLAVVLSPLVRGMRKLCIPEPLGAAAIMLLLLGAIGYGTYTLAVPAADWAHQLPGLVGQAHSRLSGLLGPLHEMQQAGQSISTLTDPAAPQSAAPAVSQQQAGPGGGVVVATTTTVLVGIGATLVLAYFLLTTGDLFLRKVVAILPRFRDKKTAVDIAQQVQSDMSAYLLTITLINCGLGALIALLLWALGLPAPLLWGAMVTLFNYVPYLGPITSFGVIFMVALVSFDSLWQVVLPPACFLCITLIEGNVFTPWLVACRLTLNTVAVFVSILFWGWMWGIPGTLIAVPLLAVFKILCDRIEPLHPVGDFLGR